MKVIGNVEVLQPGAEYLWIPRDTFAAVGIRRNVTLYVVAIEHEGERDRAELTPRATILASPFPTRAWSSLLRASITVPSGPGGFARLFEALQQLGLYCRHLEAVDGLRLRRREKEAEDQTTYMVASRGHPKKIAATQDAAHVIPTVFLVLEVPGHFVTHSESAEVSPDTTALHEHMRRLATAGVELDRAVELLQGELRRTAQIPELVVDWISPLRSTRLLAQAFLAPSSGTTATPLLLARERVRVASPPDHPRRLAIPVGHWSSVLWPQDRQRPRDVSSADDRLFALSYADSDERVVCWQLFDSHNKAIVELEFVVPAKSLEHVFFQWLFATVAEAAGSILLTYSTARLRRHWSIVYAVIAFPMRDCDDDPRCEEVVRLLGSLRNLQGRSIQREGVPGYRERYMDLEQKLPALRKQASKALFGTEESAPNDGRSQVDLQSVRVWTAAITARQEQHHLARFAPNPFYYTRPVDMALYKALVGPADAAMLSRRRAADTIARRLLSARAENIAIVGAHRIGKTSLIGMILDRLEELRSSDDAPIVLPVRINAALTTPAHLLNEVADAIVAWEANARGPVRAALTRVLAGAREVLRRALPKTMTVKAEGAIPPVPGIPIGEAKVGVELEFERDQLLAAGRLLKEQLGDDLQFLRLVLRALGEALQSAEIAGGLYIVVALDEFADLATAPNDRSALALWRHVIESREYHRISWLVAASRPIQDMGTYSPITNVFREYNLGALDRAEASRVLSAFSEPEFDCPSEGCDYATGALECPEHQMRPLLRPVLTVDARDLLLWATGRLPFLLQVAASHCYESTVRSRVPVLTAVTCRRILATRVIEELADFFESQWATLGLGRERLLAVLDATPRRGSSSPLDLLQADAWAKADWTRLPAAVSKNLARLGIATTDEVLPVAPIFLAWLQSHR